MNKQEIIVIRSEHGYFLESFSQRHNALAFEANYTDSLLSASYVPKEMYDQEGEEFQQRIKNIATMLEGHLETIEVSWESKTPYEYTEEDDDGEMTLEKLADILGWG